MEIYRYNLLNAGLGAVIVPKKVIDYPSDLREAFGLVTHEDRLAEDAYAVVFKVMLLKKGVVCSFDDFDVSVEWNGLRVKITLKTAKSFVREDLARYALNKCMKMRMSKGELDAVQELLNSC